MAALTDNTARVINPDPGAQQWLPVLASAVIYQGGAVGDNGAGKARALVAGDAFLGYAHSDHVPTAGSRERLRVETAGFLDDVAITGASAGDGDIGKEVFAANDNDLTLTANGSRVGTIINHKGANRFTVRFAADPGAAKQFAAQPPFVGLTVEAVSLASGSKTLDIEDIGKCLNVTAGSDTNVITLPATAVGARFVIRAGVDGQRIAISPNASDLIAGPDFAGVDNKDRILTAATARQGDFVVLEAYATGWVVAAQRGIWTNEP